MSERAYGMVGCATLLVVPVALLSAYIGGRLTLLRVDCWIGGAALLLIGPLFIAPGLKPTDNQSGTDV